VLEIVVKPTMSEKNIETSSNVSGSTGLPLFNCSATDLQYIYNVVVIID